MKKRLVIICTLAAAMLIGVCIMPKESGPEPQLPGSITQVNEQERLAEKATVSQTMHFQRCGHAVERRINIPETLVGANFEDVSAYYDLWLIQSMTGDSLVMERYIDLYCPAHVVLSMDEAGQVVLAENRYGDGMAILKIVNTTPTDDETRKMLIAGMGFENEKEAMQWLKDKKLTH